MNIRPEILSIPQARSGRSCLSSGNPAGLQHLEFKMPPDRVLFSGLSHQPVDVQRQIGLRLEGIEKQGFSPGNSSRLRADVIRFLETGGQPESLNQFLAAFLSAPGVAQASEETFGNILNAVFPASKNGQFLLEVPGILNALKSNKLMYEPDYLPPTLEILSRLPDRWLESVELLNHVAASFGAGLDIDPMQRELFSDAPSERFQRFLDNLPLLALARHPTQMLNYMVLNRDKIHYQAVRTLYRYLDTGNMTYGKELLPEAMAMIKQFAAMIPDHVEEETRLSALNVASEGLTRLYDYNKPPVIPQIKGITLNNWATIGTLGLSFSKWKFDTMRRWKGVGPMQKVSLMEESGFFKPAPARENDTTYYGGYLRHNPKTDVSIELRRAYIVISKPGLGTLVIRNSSPVFGRNLMAEPAYFHPEKVFGESTSLFNPDEDLKDIAFQGVLSKPLNQPGFQKQNQKNIRVLLELFEAEMEPYIGWKCGFKGGKPPAGFKELLHSALMSAQNDGVSSPFGKTKNVRLAWVNRYDLPFPVRTLEVMDPAVQVELSLMLGILEKRTAIRNDQEYATRMPRLMQFLNDGLSKNLELVLAE